MQGKHKSSYLLLQVWCGVLTVAVVILAALSISIKSKLTEDDVPTQKPSPVSPAGPTGPGRQSSVGSSPSYIQLTYNNSWQCQNCQPVSSLTVDNGTIVFKEGGLHVVYAHVTFKEYPQEMEKHVILKRDASSGKRMFLLVEGMYPELKEGSVWIAKIVNLTKDDRVSLDIKGSFFKNKKLTFWGAYQLR